MGKNARDVRVREGNFTLRLELDRKCSKTGLPISGKLASGVGHSSHVSLRAYVKDVAKMCQLVETCLMIAKYVIHDDATLC